MQGFTILCLTVTVFEVVYAINDDIKPINMFLRPEPVLKPRWRRSLLGPMPYGYFHSPIEPWAEEMNHVPDSNVDSYRHPVWAFRQPPPTVQKSYQNNFKSLFEHAGPFEKEVATTNVAHSLTPESDINKFLALHMANIHGNDYKQSQQVMPEDNISVQLLANVYHHYPALPTVEPTVVYELNMPIVVVQESKNNEEMQFKPPVPWFYTTPKQNTKDVESIFPVTDVHPSTTETSPQSGGNLTTTEISQNKTAHDLPSMLIDITTTTTTTTTESSWISSDEEITSSYNSNFLYFPRDSNIKLETTPPTTNELAEVEGKTESYIGEIVDNISQEFPIDAQNLITRTRTSYDYNLYD